MTTMTYSNTVIKDFADFMEPIEPVKPPKAKPRVFRAVPDNSNQEFEEFLIKELKRIERMAYAPIRYLEAVEIG